MSRERVDIGLPPAGKLALLGAGLLLVAMIVLLVAQLSVLADSREHIVAQDRKINRIVKGADPLFGEAEPLAGEARRLVRETRPFVSELRAEMIPLLRDLRGVDPQPLFRLADQGNELIDALRASEAIPRTLRAADVVPELPRILRETLDVQRSTLRVQQDTRTIQRRTLAIQERLLAIQEEALVHIRSIDRKTGPAAPDTGAPAPVPAAPR